jgi:hypothetical protein
MKINYLIFICILIVSLSSLSSCGGGADDVNSSVDNTGNTNNAPIAEAGDNQNVTTGSSVSLDGNNSSDPNSDSLTYAWTLTSMPNGSGATLINSSSASPRFTVDVDGTYNVSLVVNDGTVYSSADTVTITVKTANTAPVAEAGNDQAVTAGALVTLDAIGSSDADNDGLTYLWTLTDIPRGSSAILSATSALSVTFNTDLFGTYTASLVVNDGIEDSSGDTVVVTASNDDEGPVDFDFRLSAHNSNVLMVKANVITSEVTEVSIQFKSTDTQGQATSKSSASLEHDITVVGLRPETNYQFTAVITNQSGEITTSEPQAFTTPALPFDLPDIQLKTSSDNSYLGVTFFAVSGTDSRFIGLDEAGIPVWYLHGDDVPMTNNSPVIKYIGDNQLMLLLRSNVWIIDMAGNVLSTYELPNYHHEATLLDSGNIAVLVNTFEEFNGNSLKGDRIEEYDSAGNLVWQWSSFEHLDTDRFPGALSTRAVDGAMEWTHSNAIHQQDNGSLLLSVRSQSWVVNIDHTSGDINWILGSAEGSVKESLKDKFLTLEEGSWMSAQHAPMKTANGDYLIYDNRNEAELAGVNNNSRAVKYQVNPTAMTATQVWESVVDKYTQSLGDVDELPNGNILITAGGPGTNEDAYLVEVTAAVPSQVVWELHVNNNNIYRAERIGWEALLTLNNEASSAELTLLGKITGLHADGLALINGDEILSISAGATTFEFTTNMSQDSTYNIQLSSEPNNHICTINNGSGAMSFDSSDVSVTCNDNKVNYDLTHLPIGDPLILQRALGDDGPEVGKLWLCRVPADGGGAAASDDWKNEDGTWNYITKPKVEGANIFDSEFNVALDGQGNRVITGNNLPIFSTGTFPIERGTTAWDYDKNPNYISSHVVNITFDAVPTVNDEPSCVGFGSNGISLAGSAIYQGSSTLGTDAAAWEILDNNGGHTDGTETYHYHYLAEAVLEELDPDDGGHSKLMGYMQDGFGLFGPRGEDGDVLASADLDVCHGHTHEIEWDGEVRDMFHYHWTYDFPYNVGCFRGTPQDLGINGN